MEGRLIPGADRVRSFLWRRAMSRADLTGVTIDEEEERGWGCFESLLVLEKR